jgi:hypothetical protein
MHRLQLSVVGYWFEQFTDDTLNGMQFLDGHRSKVFAIGPQVRYQFARGSVALKWLHGTSAENRPQGDRVQMQFAVPFWKTGGFWRSQCSNLRCRGRFAHLPVREFPGLTRGGHCEILRIAQTARVRHQYE